MRGPKNHSRMAFIKLQIKKLIEVSNYAKTLKR